MGTLCLIPSCPATVLSAKRPATGKASSNMRPAVAGLLPTLSYAWRCLNVSNPPVQKDRRLGKGLAALLGTPLEEDNGLSRPARPAANKPADREAAPTPRAKREEAADDSDRNAATAAPAAGDRSI